MTVPFLIVSGFALGVTLAVPAAALADPADAVDPASMPMAADALAHAPPGIEAPGAQAVENDDGLDSDAPAGVATNVHKDNDMDNLRVSPGLADDHSELPPIDGKPIALTLSPLPDDVVAAGAATLAAPASGAPGKAITLASGPDEPPAVTVAPPTHTSAAGEEALDEPTLDSPLAQELIAGFYSRINVLGYGVIQDPVNSTLNPNNALGIQRYQTQLALRPDFSLNFRQLELGIKPRFEADWDRVQNGVQGGTDLTTATAYINEWIARYRVTDKLLVSYGRENLQWGPSQLLSPSNPFNQNNGKNNPAIEQPGLDYARVVAIPNSSFTGSFIANTGAGRLNDSTEASGPFHKAYASKFDYTGEKTYFSLIVSKRDTTPWRIGYFGGWNVSDAWLLYSEGSAALSTNPALPHPDYDLLAGATYTLMNGAMITGEYFHHNAGCTTQDIAHCTSALTLDPTNPYPRRDYLLLQYVDSKLVRNVSLTVRVIQDLNDHSTQLLSDVEYEVGKNWLLYFVPSVTLGPSRSEFGSLVRYSIFAGASFTF
ncbi:MAG TPA: hypothetical protein VG320_12040 [Paraburkholderia sp.]|jgi:hypothetical protein|uniref:hypothetical protein n=1 Tax=Paraburkholderia sp. TaxID=1926495 RepID=UPI002DE29A24|nr:hypothetical protein [Paraburkholderia sp.]